MRRTSHVCSGTGHGRITQAELLKLQKSGQFPDESVRTKGAPVHYVNANVPENIMGDKDQLLEMILSLWSLTVRTKKTSKEKINLLVSSRQTLRSHQNRETLLVCSFIGNCK